VVRVREALPEDLPRVARFYSETQYAGRPSPIDRIIVAEHAGHLVGAFRLAREEGVLVLRGMRVAAVWRRRGVGTRMLNHLEAALRETCFCIPYSHLTAFYAGANFVTTSESPTFLRERITEYRSRGLDVCLMVRESVIPGQPAA
jgi:GNAT superfamily N-acetyltransferase